MKLIFNKKTKKFSGGPVVRYILVKSNKLPEELTSPNGLTWHLEGKSNDKDYFIYSSDELDQSEAKNIPWNKEVESLKDKYKVNIILTGNRKLEELF